MRTPYFWYRESILSTLLIPLAWVYNGVNFIRWQFIKPYKAEIPIICIGNIVSGGAGKTPTALTLGAQLISLGRSVHFISRGYAGRLSGPIRVDLNKHTAHDVGDEPLLLAKCAPTWVSRDRVAGVAKARLSGADIVILDDGFQNPRLVKDLSLVVIDVAQGLGNGRVHPAGPLREPANRALDRADAVILVAGNEPASSFSVKLENLPQIQARLIPRQNAISFSGERIVAFAGIGRPERFFQTIRDLNGIIVGTQSFNDHHYYNPEEIMFLVEWATSEKARLVTTAKDYVRLPDAAHPMVEVIEVDLEFVTYDALEILINPLLR